MMNTQKLIDTAGELTADDKGLLAMDESNRADCNRAARRGDYSASMEIQAMEPVGGQQ